jgi:hypothetical protein
MAAADDSYDFTNLDNFVDRLLEGYKLVIGNRFTGSIMPGAMPALNRYFGNPLLSFGGRKLFSSAIGDFHCGMRGFEREAILKLELRCPGMEFASEMVVKASLAQLNIAEVPITLGRDGRQRQPHLRPWRDGWRHLQFMLLRSPQWLFLYPGLALAILGALGAASLVVTPIRVPGIFTLDINALLYFSIATTLGVQIVYFGLFAQAFAKKMKLKITQRLAQRLLYFASHGGSVAVGVLLVMMGAGGAIFAIAEWGHTSFGVLVPSNMMRITIPAVTTLAIGTQIVFGGFLLGFIEVE